MRYLLVLFTTLFFNIAISNIAVADNCSLNTNPKTIEEISKLGDAYFTGYIDGCKDLKKRKVKIDYPKAKYWYQKAAELGHGKSQLRLAFLYAEKHFTGVENDYSKAEYWFKKAAEQDAGDARFRLGNFYQHYVKPPKYDKALYWLELAAKGGHRVAQYDLANFYLEGKGNIEKNTQKWLYWIEKAAKRGNLHAQIALSKAYELGINGLKQDIQKSITWAIKIANKNKSLLWYRKIADSFWEGRGNLPQNKNIAKIWYNKATKKGDEFAKQRLRDK